MFLPSTLAVAIFVATSPGAPPDTVFDDVNVVPMDAERVLVHQRVVVHDGVISEIAPMSSAPTPSGATVVLGGSNFYLVPGLADVHTHADTTEDLLLYLSRGVTTTLNLGNASEGFVHAIRPAVERGEIVGPHCYVALLVDGADGLGHLTAHTPVEARALVALAQSEGYDFIKVYNSLSAESFTALMDEARVRHFPVVGHGVRAVGVEKQLAAGQVMLAHVEEYLYTTFRDGLDEARIPAAVSFTKNSGAYVTPTLSTYEAIAAQWGKPGAVAALLAGPSAAFLRPETIRDWSEAPYASRSGSLDTKLAFLKKLTKALADGGVPLLTGTDAPVVPGMFPGFSEVSEIDALTKAGLSRFQALSAATRTPGEFLHRFARDTTQFGTVAVGRRADLLLLGGNPLANVEALNQIEGVMVGGRWSTRASLDAAIAAQQEVFDDAETTRIRARPHAPITTRPSP